MSLMLRDGKFSFCLLLIVTAAFLMSPSGSLQADSINDPLAQLSPEERKKIFTKIKVVDEETGRGIPAVGLFAKFKRFYTDSNGIIAFWEPGIEERVSEVRTDDHTFRFYLDVTGYEFNQPFGFGVDLKGGNTQIVTIPRTMIAERLYRVTGQGIYEDSYLVGADIPIDEPLLNGKKMGGGVTSTAVFNDKVHWFIAGGGSPDKTLLFNTFGATSILPENGGLSPLKGVNLQYFENADGSAKPILNVPDGGGGQLAIFRVMVVEDDGQQKMFAYYVRQRPQSQKFKNELDLSVLREQSHGIAKWDSSENRFVHQATFDSKKPYDIAQVLAPYHNTFKVKENGKSWFYFTNPYPTLRVPANESDLTDPGSYRVFTPLQAGSSWDPQSPSFKRDENNEVEWGWETLTPPVTDLREATLVENGSLAKSRGIHHLRDKQTGDSVDTLGGSVYWNPHRQKWVMMGTELRGSTSNLGEVWYAEADSPLGPWVYAQKIITHDKHTFSTPTQHPFFDQSNGQVVYLQGTFSEDFQDKRIFRVSKYDDNQMMYRVDLSDTRLFMPTAVYRSRHSDGWHHYRTKQSAQNPAQGASTIPFYALPTDRVLDGAKPVWEVEKEVNGVKVTELTTDSSKATSSSPVFYTPPNDQFDTDPIVPLHEYQKDGGQELIYRTEFQPTPDDFTQTSSTPVAFVWGSPRLDPPRNPAAKPVLDCVGSSAHCP